MLTPHTPECEMNCSSWLEPFVQCWEYLCIVWEVYKKEKYWNNLVPALTSRDLPSCTSEIMKCEFKRLAFIRVSMEAKRETSCLKVYFLELFLHMFQRNKKPQLNIVMKVIKNCYSWRCIKFSSPAYMVKYKQCFCLLLDISSPG